MDDRPVVKQDLNDLKKHIDDAFKAQSNARSKVYEKLEEVAEKGVEHSIKIEHIEARLGRVSAGMTTLFIGFILALVKFGLDTLKGS